jgi:hypothetical protein
MLTISLSYDITLLGGESNENIRWKNWINESHRRKQRR